MWLPAAWVYPKDEINNQPRDRRASGSDERVGPIYAEVGGQDGVSNIGARVVADDEYSRRE